MAVADINKWISGETEVFFLPNATLSVTVDCNPGKEGSTASSARRKFVFPFIAAVVAIFAFVALAFVVIPMRHPVDPASEADAKPQPSESGPASTRAQAAGDVARSTPIAPVPKEITSAVTTPILSQPITVPAPQVATFLRDLRTWYDQRTKAPSIPVRKPSPQQTSRRHGPRDSGPAQADSGETTRLMVNELRQREVGILSALRHEHPE